MTNEEPKVWTIEATVRTVNRWATDKEMAEHQTRQHLTSLGYSVVAVTVIDAEPHHASDTA